MNLPVWRNDRSFERGPGNVFLPSAILGLGLGLGPSLGFVCLGFLGIFFHSAAQYNFYTCSTKQIRKFWIIVGTNQKIDDVNGVTDRQPRDFAKHDFIDYKMTTILGLRHLELGFVVGVLVFGFF